MVPPIPCKCKDNTKGQNIYILEYFRSENLPDPQVVGVLLHDSEYDGNHVHDVLARQTRDDASEAAGDGQPV